MKRNKKTLSPQLPGRGGEGRSTIPSQDSTNTDSLSQAEEKQYHHILRTAIRAGVYGDMAGDVAVEAWLKARERGYYCRSMISEAARNLKLWRISRETELDEKIPCGGDELLRREQRERIEEAIQYSSPQICKACRLIMIEGVDMGDAARAVGMSAAAFSLALKQIGEKRGSRRSITLCRNKGLLFFSARCER